MLQCEWHEVWPRFSEAPVKFMGLPAFLTVGSPANFCLVEVAEPNQLQSLQTFVEGETVPTPP